MKLSKNRKPIKSSTRIVAADEEDYDIADTIDDISDSVEDIQDTIDDVEEDTHQNKSDTRELDSVSCKRKACDEKLDVGRSAAHFQCDEFCDKCQ